uniref:Uncharacterized protein n=1 Tax=Fundulus heteroclitus TaxID=8078 RepID=A0A3Q2PDE5_FUNHE
RLRFPALTKVIVVFGQHTVGQNFVISRIAVEVPTHSSDSSISLITNCCQNIAACSLEVVDLAIKGAVVRISRGRAGAVGVGMAAKLTRHNLAGLLRPTCTGGTLDYTSYTITGAKALTFFTVPELFTSLPIASFMITTT